ncbi:MAG: 50S ribosomal protein L10 [Bacteroidales bacterium]
MRKEEKAQVIEGFEAVLEQTPDFYIADISGLNADDTSSLRRACFEKDIKLVVVKNTLFRKALQNKENEEIANLYPTLVGPSAIMFTTVPNAPAKLIKEFGAKTGKPALKAAYLQECSYIGEDKLATLISIKSKEELIGDVIGLLQSPVKNVISGLKANSADLVAGLVKTLSEKE